MIDDIVGLAVAASIDVAANKAAKRQRWARVFQVITAILFIAMIVSLIYITVAYS